MNQYQPGQRLAPYVESYLCITAHKGANKSIPPHSSYTMTFRVKGSHRYLIGGEQGDPPASSLTGLRKLVKHNALSENSELIIVKFHPWGAHAFFKQPLHELSGIGTPLGDILGAVVIRDLESQLNEAPSDGERIHQIEKFLIAIQKRESINPVVPAALRKMRNTNGKIRMTELAASLNISLDTMEKRFKEVTGGTPKQLASIQRMTSVIRRLPRYDSLTRLAYDAGYFDQAHFIRDFKHFTGQLPSRYLS